MKKKLNKDNQPIEIKIEDFDNVVNLEIFKVLNLDLAGIFFVNANEQIQLGHREYLRLQKEYANYKLLYKKRAEKFSIESDDFIAYQLNKLRDIEIFYEPVVRHFSTAKILLVCCAETYINEVAGVVLKGQSLNEFDKLSILGKWIFIQILTKTKKKLTIDKNPLQGFVQLIKERNNLVHFKGNKKKLDLFEIPDYLSDLKLTPKDCLNNIENVKSLIKSFSLNWKGSYGPGWLNVNDEEYRNPCFYLGNRDIPLVLYSDKNDKNRI